ETNVDDHPLFTQKDVTEMRDVDEEDPKEIDASNYELSDIARDGNIGCVVNGAGLPMATMDTINHFGGRPANFLDVGGGATEEKVTKAFELILSDENIEGIFRNIVGGITIYRDNVSGGVQAVKNVGLVIPLVVRLEGMNVKEGKQILKDSGLAITSASTMAEGAQKIIALVDENK